MTDTTNPPPIILAIGGGTVGWVERSDTHHSHALVGIAALNPPYQGGTAPETP